MEVTDSSRRPPVLLRKSSHEALNLAAFRQPRQEARRQHSNCGAFQVLYHLYGMRNIDLWAPEGGLELKTASYAQHGNSISTRTAPATYSIKHEFEGANVLLTGASGYIGSVVLEQLLRCTKVSTVRCLMRDKRSDRAEDRIAKILQGGLFHKVRDDQKLLQKVSAVKGDIIMPNLGLSPGDAETLVNEVDMIIHCAADIRLEACIQVRSSCTGSAADLQPRVNGGARQLCPGDAQSSSRLVDCSLT